MLKTLSCSSFVTGVLSVVPPIVDMEGDGGGTMISLMKVSHGRCGSGANLQR